MKKKREWVLPMKKLTLQAIAEAANVSCATVSRCLSGREGVGEATRVRVLQLCREMGYNPNFTETAHHRSGRIGFLCSNLSLPLCAKLAGDLEQHLAQLDYSLVVAQSQGNRQGEQAALQRLLAQHVDGLIVMPTGRETRKLLRSQEQVPETVYLSAYWGDLPESYVAVDHFLGGQAAVRYLHKLGHEKILFLGSEESEVCNKRRGGAVSAFRQLHINGICADVRQLDELDWQSFTAVIAGDCALARYCPESLTTVSFDGEHLGQWGISTFDSPDTMAGIAADILLEKLERPVGGYSHRMVIPQLRQRRNEVSRHG